MMGAGTGGCKHSRIVITDKPKLLSDEVILFLTLSASNKTNHVGLDLYNLIRVWHEI